VALRGHERADGRRLCADQTAEWGMEQQGNSGRTTYKHKRHPTPPQQRAMACALRRCRALSTAARHERREAWQQCGVALTSYQHTAEWPAIKEAMPEEAEVQSRVVQDVVLRVDRAFQAFFQRIRDGVTPGNPRFQGRARSTSFTSPQGEHGARLDHRFLLLSKIGRIPLRRSRPIEGTPKTVTISREADGWYACFSCADVPVQPMQPLHTTGQETGRDRGIEAFAPLSHGTRIFSPGWYRKAERALKNRPTPGLSTQAWDQSQAQGSSIACQSPSAGEATTTGFSPQNSVGAGASKRHDLP
jgi:putative transposase